ncbi:MAG: hypothetical protein QXO94_02380 [Candidatus Bathyarchaeia archaeon]
MGAGSWASHLIPSKRQTRNREALGSLYKRVTARRGYRKKAIVAVAKQGRCFRSSGTCFRGKKPTGDPIGSKACGDKA